MFFYLFLEYVDFFLRSEFKMNITSCFVPFGPPQAQNFAVFRFLFTFLHVSGAISVIFEREFSTFSKKSTYSVIFQLGVRGNFQKIPGIYVEKKTLVTAPVLDHLVRKPHVSVVFYNKFHKNLDFASPT